MKLGISLSFPALALAKERAARGRAAAVRDDGVEADLGEDDAEAVVEALREPHRGQRVERARGRAAQVVRRPPRGAARGVAQVLRARDDVRHVVLEDAAPAAALALGRVPQGPAPRVALELRAERGRREAEHLGSTRVVQRRFNVSVPRARVPEKAPTLRDRSER